MTCVFWVGCIHEVFYFRRREAKCFCIYIFRGGGGFLCIFGVVAVDFCGLEEGLTDDIHQGWIISEHTYR